MALIIHRTMLSIISVMFDQKRPDLTCNLAKMALEWNLIICLYMQIFALTVSENNSTDIIEHLSLISCNIKDNQLSGDDHQGKEEY